MLELERPGDLAHYVGKEIGVSDWFTVDQAIIDKFADATGDHQWIYVDVERAKREMPGGKTIAHGEVILSLVPAPGANHSTASRIARAGSITAQTGSVLRGRCRPARAFGCGRRSSRSNR